MPLACHRGRQRPLVPPVNAEYLHKRLPKSKLEFIDALHFVWEDAADTYVGGRLRESLVTAPAGNLAIETEQGVDGRTGLHPYFRSTGPHKNRCT